MYKSRNIIPHHLYAVRFNVVATDCDIKTSPTGGIKHSKEEHTDQM